MPKDKKITLEVDFDDVIRNSQTGEPVEGVQRALRWLKQKGRIVIISTARDDLGEVQKWLDKHNIKFPLTNRKIKATAIIDDRAIRFTNWNDITHYF
jgi:phosphoglycolate phosphatase-like HAD superfamily hydrolase